MVVFCIPSIGRNMRLNSCFYFAHQNYLRSFLSNDDESDRLGKDNVALDFSDA